MPFGLAIGTDRAAALQKAIEDELVARGYSPEADSVMAEYITIMIINNKNTSEITGELIDLVGPEYDESFTAWLFQEAAKGASGEEAAPPTPAPQPIPTHTSESSTSRSAGGAAMFQGAVAQATSSSGQKRPAPARSPSPSQPAKTRRTDVPHAPRADRAMQNQNGGSSSRSLIDRIGGPPPRQPRNHNNFSNHDGVQARIDAVTHHNHNGMNQIPPMGPMGPMGMNPQMIAGMEGNPMALQEMMMNQMALMAQMASSMGILNPGAMGLPGPGPGPGHFNNNNNNGMGRGGPSHRGRGHGRGGFNGGPQGMPPQQQQQQQQLPTELNATAPAFSPSQNSIVAPKPVSAATTTVGSTPSGVTPPTRPLSPTLCKFGVRCTNATCRYSHPSPIATSESGVVLSSDACEAGANCEDADCVKGHVSPAVKKGGIPAPNAPSATPIQPVAAASPSAAPCRYGAACARQNSGCTFQHPSAAPCRFGSGCTRANCTFQHPPGRVLPNTFIRGVEGSKAVNIVAPPTGTIGAHGMNKSLKFNDADKAASAAAAARADLEKKMRDIEERKKAVAAKETSITAKKEETVPAAA